jgi:hypothetical protein
MSQLGVQIQNLHVQDNKRFVNMQKTKADSNKVWDQIKLVDKNCQQDLMAEITYAAEAVCSGSSAELASAHLHR